MVYNQKVSSYNNDSKTKPIIRSGIYFINANFFFFTPEHQQTEGALRNPQGLITGVVITYKMGKISSTVKIGINIQKAFLLLLTDRQQTLSRSTTSWSGESSKYISLKKKKNSQNAKETEQNVFEEVGADAQFFHDRSTCRRDRKIHVTIHIPLKLL